MNLNELSPLSELVSFIDESLLKYKTPASKKAFLTRQIKQHEAWVADVKEAIERKHNPGMLHGEVFRVRHLIHYQNELNILYKRKQNI